MADKLGLGGKLKGINPMDNLFGLEETEDVKKIRIELLKHYSCHKFSLYSGNRKKDLTESIKAHGILTPIIVTPYDSEYYMILAGHNRVECAKDAGLEEVPARVLKDLSADEEKQIVIETNLFQRGFAELKISERASIIADYYDLMKKQGKNTKDIETELNNINNNDDVSPVGTNKSTGTREIGKEYSLSKNTIARLLKINTLNDGLKEKVDNEEISIRAAVDLSCLSNEEQIALLYTIRRHDIKVDMKIAEKIKKEKTKNNIQLSVLDIENLIIKKKDTDTTTEEKVKQKPVKLKPNIVQKYFTEKEDDEIQSIIEKALEKYFSNGDDKE